MTLGKSIRIYLKEGTVTGIKLAEVVNLTIQSLSCPRNKLSGLNKHFLKESNRPGVYFLLGTDDETNRAKVYIGEAENVWDRLKSHDIKKDFWNEVILFTSKDDNLTKSHVKYLESRLIHISISADRYVMENHSSPNLNSLPLSDQDAMEEFIINTKLLTGVLGHKFLENATPLIETAIQDIPLTASTENNMVINSTNTLELELKVRGIKAKALQTDEGIVVLEGSEISEKVTGKLQVGYKELRKELIREGTIKDNGNGKMVFSKNYLFKNASPAAAVIVGYNINGRSTWKNKSGKSLKETEENAIKVGNTLI